MLMKIRFCTTYMPYKIRNSKLVYVKVVRFNTTDSVLKMTD
jgi:hypothetical protein